MPPKQLHAAARSPGERQRTGLWPALAEAAVVAGLAMYAVVLLIPVVARLGPHLGQ